MALVMIRIAARRRTYSFVKKSQQRHIITPAASSSMYIQTDERYAFSCGRRQRLLQPLRHQQDQSLSSVGGPFEMRGTHAVTTNTIASSDKTENKKFHENSTQILLESSSGSWDSEMRNQAVKSIRFWTSSIPSSNKNKPNDVESDDIMIQPSLAFSVSLKLWNRLVEEERKNEHFIFVDKQQLFHKILLLWRKQDPSFCQVQYSPQEMISLIQDRSSRGIIQSTDATYNIILSALPQIMKQPPRHLRQRQQWLQQQQRNANNNNNNHQVDQTISTTTTTNPEEFADTILRQMVVRNDIPNPTMTTFTTVLNLWASGTHPERISRVQKLEQLRKVLANENQIIDNKSTPNDKSNNMHNMKSTLMYKSILINAYAKAGRPHDCEAIWEDWWGDFAQDKTIEPPNIQVATTILSGWSKANNPIRAESFLRDLVEMHEEGILKEPPNSYSYTVVLDAWAKARVRNGAERAEAILREMENDVSFQPTVVAYTSVIQAYAKIGGIKKAESLFKSMISAGLQPNTMSFNALLQGIENIGQATMLVRRMKAICQSQRWDCAPDVATYSTLMRLCAQRGDSLKAERIWEEMINGNIKPDAMAYNHRLNAYTQSGKPGQAQTLLDEMIRNYLYAITTNNNVETSHNASMPAKPETISFNTVLSAWADKTNIQQAEALFQNLKDLQPKIRDLKPNVVTYTILLNCWSKSIVGEEIMIKRVKSLFQEMEANDKLQPNLISYSTLCKCFARCGMGQAAISTILRMRRKGIEPNNAVYAQVLHALAEQCARNPDDLSTLDTIEEQLREMVEVGVTPTIPMFSAWLKAIGASSIPDKGRVANEVVDAMESVGLKPNDVILRQLERIHNMS